MLAVIPAAGKTFLGEGIMNYLIFALVAAASAAAVYFYGQYAGVFKPAVLNVFKQKDTQQLEVFSKKWTAILLAVLFTVIFVAQLFLHKNTETLGFVKLFGLFLLVICAALVDFKKKIIPNILTVVGMFFWVCITLYEFLNADNFKAVLISELLGFAVGFGILALVSLFTKGAMGFGDVKLFGLIGLIGGFYCTYSTLLIALICSVAVSVIGMARKKLGRKDSIPFGPCIACGYFITLLLSNY